jgi:hypothetical protein
VVGHAGGGGRGAYGRRRREQVEVDGFSFLFLFAMGKQIKGGRALDESQSGEPPPPR